MVDGNVNAKHVLLDKESKKLITAGNCFVVVLGSELSDEACDVIHAATDEWIAQDTRKRPVMVLRGNDVSTFRKAASLFNGVDSFVAAVHDFAQGGIYVAPLTESAVAPWVCSVDANPPTCVDKQAFLNLLLDFRTRADSLVFRKALQAKLPPLSTHGEKMMDLPSFVRTVFLGDRPSLVLFVTESCPICPPAIELLNAVAEEFNNDATFFCFNVAHNDIPTALALDAEEREKQRHIARVPLFRWYPARHPERPVNFEQQRSEAALRSFVIECLAEGSVAPNAGKVVVPNMKRLRDNDGQ
uniref:Thioredoxin domain-containing protein n=1 Tax=Neobodo designis TaxID=312471 RepID=A0A7S1QP70_NEODS